MATYKRKSASRPTIQINEDTDKIQINVQEDLNRLKSVRGLIHGRFTQH